MQLTLVAIALFASVAFATPIADNEGTSVIARSEQSAKRDAIASPEDHGYDYKHKYYDEHYNEHYNEHYDENYDEYKHYKPGEYDGYHESKPNEYDGYHESKPENCKYYDEHYDEYKHYKPGEYDGHHKSKPENCKYYDNYQVKRSADNYKIHKVVVGGPNILAYNPPQIFAKKGDKILFTFMAKNHTLTSSEFKTPCTPNGDFDTNFVANLDNKPGITREFYVRDEKPHWFFCRQATHCSKGMVFALNPTPKNTFEKFQQMARATASKDTGVAIPPFHGRNNK